MPNQINRDIYVLSSKVKDPIDYVRLTNDIPIVFTFRDYDILPGSAAQVYVQKPSGKAVYDTAEISGNVVTVTVTDQMFAELGVSDLQIRITQGDEKLVSFSQPVRVHPNYTDGDAEQSKNAGGFFDDAEQAVENANQAAGLANQAAQAANEAAEAVREAVSGVINDDQASTLTTYSSSKIDEKLQQQTQETVIDDSTTSDTKTFSSQKINNTYLQKTGDASKTTVTYETSTGNAPASRGKLSALIGWLVGKCGQIGTLTALATTAKDTLVNAINEIFNNIGNLTGLDTADKTSVVGAINEVFLLAGSKLIVVNVPKALLTANCSYRNGYVKSLFSVNLPSSLGLGANSGQSDWRNVLFVAGYILNYGSVENYNDKQIILDLNGMQEASSGVYTGAAISAKMGTSGIIEAELDVPSFNDTDASVFKGNVGNMLILVGKQADFTTVTANNNSYS